MKNKNQKQIEAGARMASRKRAYAAQALTLDQFFKAKGNGFDGYPTQTGPHLARGIGHVVMAKKDSP